MGLIRQPRMRTPAGALRAWLPKGGLLAEDVWQARHRWIVRLLWVHAAVIAVVVSFRGFDPLHSLLEGSIVAVSALLASRGGSGRRARGMVASFGLLSASAILVHLSGGYIEMHFHFFVMIIVISLYQDWSPFLLAIGYVVLHHGIVGVLDPGSVYNHPDAIVSPWKWAGIHGFFILGASIASLVSWRLNEAMLLSRLATERQARAAAEEGLRLREEFLSVATHELRTPVTSIKGYAQLALRAVTSGQPRGRERLNQTLSRLDEQCDRLARLITQLLDASRIQGGRLVLEAGQIDLGEVVQRSVASAQDRSAMHTWEVDVEPGLIADADDARIDQVITNLLDNAIRYSPRGGAIEVTARRLDDRVEVAVADEGMGIPEGDLERVFERFYQTPSGRDLGGMGLGLFISQEIARAHGGKIVAERRPGKGSRFVFSIPLAAPRAVGAAARSQQDDRPDPGDRGSARRAERVATGLVLVVEDEAPIRAILVDILTEEGYAVKSVADGREALASLAGWDPDVIVLDKQMPHMDGTAFADAYRRRIGRHAPIVALCAVRDAADWAAEIGARAVVTKPFDVHELLTTVAGAIDAADPISA
jgi:signal transduction histidine kinase/CheY-like chemotaxis protein